MESTEQLGNLLMLVKLTHPWWFFVILGVVAGIVSGLLGVGSGVVIVPALVLFCAMAQKSAQGTALALMVPMALLGAYRYWRNPEIEVNYYIVGLLVCGAMVGVLIGTDLAARIPGYVLRKVFACFLIIVAVRMFFFTRPQTTARPDDGSVPVQQTDSPTEVSEDAAP